MERRDGEKKRSAALGPGLAARDPPPAPGRWPHLSAAASYVVSRDGGRAALHSYAAEAGSGAGNGNGSAGLGGTWSCGARGDGGCGGHGTRCPGDLMPSPPGNRTAGPLLRCRGGGAARPDPPPGAGRAAGAAAGRCARVLRDGEGRCAEMGTVWDTGTVRRDGDSAQHGDSVQRWAPRAPQPGALPGMSAPGGARSAGAHRALRAITLRCVPRAAAPLCCRPVPSPRAITLVRVKTAPLRVENPAGLRSHSGWDAPGRAGRQGDAPRPRFGRWMGKARLGGKALGSVNERD